jgi:N-methylhydantoinase A
LEEVDVRRSLEVSYNGQILNFDVAIAGGPVTPATIRGVLNEFVESYNSIYGPGAAASAAGFAIKGFRITANERRGVTQDLSQLARADAVAEIPQSSSRVALVSATEERYEEIPVLRGELLSPKEEVKGPAILEFVDTTVFVPRGYAAYQDEFTNVIIELA